MARRRGGRPVHGWLILDKPVGVTSTEAVGKARWALGAQKAGHAGTLDPLASGLLAIAFGEATKTIPHVQEGLKTYRFTIRLGQATGTDDAEGAVIAESDDRPDDAAIRAALGAHVGEIEQVPPQFSAVRVEGARAYDLAREGERLDLAPRPLWVESLDLVGRPDADHAELELVCGKGGYVRALARDLGRDLGCHAHVSALRRVASGAFTLEGALSWEALEALRDDPEPPLLPVAAGLSDLTEVRVPAAQAGQLRNGQAVPVTSAGGWGEPAWASHGGQPVALGRLRGGRLVPERVFAGLAG